MKPVGQDIKPFLISQNASLKDAMKQLEATSQKSLFVVENGSSSSEFIGSLTDGDIRRWILAEGTLQDPVGKACNRSPYWVGTNYDLDAVRQRMLAKSIVCVPAVNDRREIVELLFWDNVFLDGRSPKPTRTIDLPVVIMAGGLGSRLGAFTRILPKPLIPLGDKTVIEVIIDSFLKYGVNRFIISVNYKSKIIKSYFEELNPPYSVEFLCEDKPLGTVGALQYLKGKINTPFLVTNCDTIINADLNELIDFHQEHGDDLTLVASLKNFNIPYGICEIVNGGTLTRITEKPDYNVLANTGMYVLSPEKLRLIPDGESFNIIQLIEKVKTVDGKVGVFPIGDKDWIDTGEWAEYKKALNQLNLS
jgi:dTDP-glucose pyrophosphorylase